MIKSIAESADDSQNVEFIIRLHDDEPKHLQAISEIVAAAPRVRIAVGPTLRGYASLDKFFDEAIALSTGKWIWQLNDDAIIEGQGWDTKLAEIENWKCIVIPQLHQLNESLYSNDQGSPFPMVPRGTIFTPEQQPLPYPPDTKLTSSLLESGHKLIFLEGIKTHHQREVDPIVEAQRQAGAI